MRSGREHSFEERHLSVWALGLQIINISSHWDPQVQISDFWVSECCSVWCVKMKTHREFWELTHEGEHPG